MYSRHSLSLLAAAVALALPFTASAQDATELDEVVVTATRTIVPLQDSLAPTQLITRDDIERSQSRSLVDLLKGRAGIGFSNQGGLGKLSTINIRGTESDHVLVLVDGIRIGSATAGLASFQDLPVDQIERIEIVRGPRSSLYGSEAIGGVIQIFTRRGSQGLSRELRVGGGSNNLREASGGFSYGGERGWIGANAAYQETDGINACRGSGTLFQGCFTDEPDDDGYRNVSLNVRGGYQLSDTLALEGHVLNANAFNEFDGSIYGGNEADNVQQVLGSKLTWKPSAGMTLTAQVGRASDKSDNYFADAAAGTRTFVSTFDTRRDTASLQGDFAFGERHLLSAGADWQRDEVTSSIDFVNDTIGVPVDSRDNTGMFIEYQGRFGAQQVQASVRNDDNDQFGNHVTGNLGWGLGFGSGFKLTANAGTGFKAPTFNDLYYPFSGNALLEPERSKTLDIGLSQYGDAWNWGVNVYETRIKDLIALDSNWLPANTDEARIRGFELTGAVTLAGFDIAAQVSRTDPRNRTAGLNYDNLLARRARNTARLDVDRAFGDFRIGVTGYGASQRYDNAANSVGLAGYGTLDLRLEYAITKEWSVQARASNVFDREYETIAWYNQPGREYGLSLRYRARD
ncbi:vitamin B12 transporter [Pseudoxanthomonas japonensis]|uniref:TonB-dependent vitamin B12 receptor n=1 Tax=Pseudoxanthomonas japonensis TaxID=69284 RepID=UPI001A3864E0|nr:TonB-dependent vitamin B12 receptor [Pseudoxanthomonas japonensis]MBL8255916.1 TonB-dependent vitamin B12 receptor [Pseudoxanthomonas mexicana]MDR7069992.1 vitamin B12 transporter [Pseudoxanthomonas japonensis]